MIERVSCFLVHVMLLMARFLLQQSSWLSTARVSLSLSLSLWRKGEDDRFAPPVILPIHPLHSKLANPTRILLQDVKGVIMSSSHPKSSRIYPKTAIRLFNSKSEHC